MTDTQIDHLTELTNKKIKCAVQVCDYLLQHQAITSIQGRGLYRKDVNSFRNLEFTRLLEDYDLVTVELRDFCKEHKL
jgi:hypothetical protein